ncbi:MAG: hypothetical protein FJ279_11445 [Planctomycetes bacterium]|nr:hypothetical protein [Planctomycetota bacterium]
MTSRERITTILNGGVPDRVGMHESLWAETVKRWRKEGLGEKESPHDLFDMDLRHIGVDMSFQFPSQVIEDTPGYVIEKNANGVTLKRIKDESGHTPHWIDHTIKSRKDWLEHRHRLVPKPDRIPANFAEQFAAVKKTGRFVCLTMCEPYETIWSVPGQVRLFEWMLDDPELVEDMFSACADLIIGMTSRVLEKGFDYDGLWFWGDLGYRNATLFSPKLYDQLLWPHHKRICDHLRKLRKPSILHSCGKIEALIPRFIEAGFNAIQPLEAKVGQDVRLLKKQFGNRITFFGNMDVRKLSGTRADVREEVLSKLEVAKQGGGYIFHSDHSVPPTVSFDNYRYAVELVKEYGRYDR